MSGTSLDGVDYALTEINGSKIALQKLWSRDYPKALREKLLRAASNKATSYELCQLHHDLGRFYAQACPSLRCDYVGLHGQTVFHNPDKKNPATFQLGEAAYLGAKLNVSVINQFRAMDMALGGQGAPLATLFHKLVFSEKNKDVAVNNLGGISNVTFLPKGGGRIFSFDTGPANILIDQAMAKLFGKSCDLGGRMASYGIPDMDLVLKWLNHPFFKKRPPKSTGREDFGKDFVEKALTDCRKKRLSKYDIVATLTQLTAESLAQAYIQFLPRLPQRVILAGGGAANPTLKKEIEKTLRAKQWKIEGKKLTAPIEVVTSDDLGWPNQSIEPAAFALLAYRRINQKAGNIPQTTGARREALLGQIL